MFAAKEFKWVKNGGSGNKFMNAHQNSISFEMHNIAWFGDAVLHIKT